MDETEILRGISSHFKDITKKPECFLSIQDSFVDDAKESLKQLYDYLKSKEKAKSQALSELIVDSVDEEQIWQQVNIQNEEINNNLVKDVAILLSKKDNLTFDTQDTVHSADDEADELDDDSEESLQFNQADHEEEEEDDDDDDDEEISEGEKSDDDRETSLKFMSEVDDDFFKLSEMENFCDAVEKKENSSGIDLFTAEEISDEDDENRLIRYNDFFVKKQAKTNFERNNDKRSGKKVTFQNDTEEYETVDSSQSYMKKTTATENDLHSSIDNEEPKSAFEARQGRLKKRIETLENEALQEKPWHLKGEISSSTRPQNSLLEEYVEFDVGARSAPVFTEKTTLRLEDVIKQRIKDKVWDDVPRKVKPVEDIREYKKQLVLDQEKSKLSLAEIYEQAYVKQRDADNPENSELADKEEPVQHIEIQKMMRSLFTKLDALSNFHFTPKPVAPDIKIISNAPAITMEEVAPISTSDAALLAPEEVKNKPKGDILGQQERTTTDKKRDRRKKKIKQRVRQKEKLKKEAAVSKMSLGLGNKYSKEKAKNALERLTKERNIDKLDENNEKRIRSSTAFFSKLEDEMQINLKRKAFPTKKKPLQKLTAKRVKL